MWVSRDNRQSVPFLVSVFSVTTPCSPSSTPASLPLLSQQCAVDLSSTSGDLTATGSDGSETGKTPQTGSYGSETEKTLQTGNGHSETDETSPSFRFIQSESLRKACIYISQKAVMESVGSSTKSEEQKDVQIIGDSQGIYDKWGFPGCIWWVLYIGFLELGGCGGPAPSVRNKQTFISQSSGYFGLGGSLERSRCFGEKSWATSLKVV